MEEVSRTIIYSTLSPTQIRKLVSELLDSELDIYQGENGEYSIREHGCIKDIGKISGGTPISHSARLDDILSKYEPAIEKNSNIWAQQQKQFDDVSILVPVTATCCTRCLQKKTCQAFASSISL